VVWKARMPGNGVALAIFNKGNTALKVHRRLGDFGAGLARSWQVRDVWSAKDVGVARKVSVDVAGHGCVLLMLR